MEHTGSLLAAGLVAAEVEAEAVARKLEVDSPKQQKLQGDCPVSYTHLPKILHCQQPSEAEKRRG